MFKTVPQCSFLEYKESFQNQWKKRKTSLPKYPLTPHHFRCKKAGWEKDDGLMTVDARLWRKWWDWARETRLQIKPTRSISVPVLQNGPDIFRIFFKIRLDNRVTEGVQRGQPCCLHAKRSVLHSVWPLSYSHRTWHCHWPIWEQEPANRFGPTGQTASTL